MRYRSLCCDFFIGGFIFAIKVNENKRYHGSGKGPTPMLPRLIRHTVPTGCIGLEAPGPGAAIAVFEPCPFPLLSVPVLGLTPAAWPATRFRRFRLSGLLSLLANHSFSPISSSSSPEGEQPGGGGASSSRPWKKMSYLLPHLHSGWAVDQAILAEEERLVIIRFGHDWDETCMQVSSNLLTLDSNHL